MPILDWVGKESVVNHDKDVPFRLLKKDKSKSIGPNSSNLLIHGDNLEALKALMPYYPDSIKCIYIDPPYNIGNENWVFNDKVNSPKIKKWLGKVVGRESEDLSRHDKWLCMMYPRLKMLHALLSDEGIFFSSIDDNELHNLKAILNDIFGPNNFLAVLPTIMNLKGNQDEFGFAGTHEYTVVYAKNKEKCKIKNFRINDEDELEKWEEDDIGLFKKGANLKSTGKNAPREKRPYLFYPLLYDPSKDKIDIVSDEEYKQIYDPIENVFNDDFVNDLKQKYEENGLVFILPLTDGQFMTWRWERQKIKNEPYNIIIAKHKKSISIYKKQRPNLGDLPSKKPKTIFYKPEYSSGNGTAQIKRIFGRKVFDNAKPLELIKDLIEISTDKEDIILDSFAGSGTTGEAVLRLNQEDGGKRRFILVQIEESLKSPETLDNGKVLNQIIDICVERLSYSIKTYGSKDGFEYCELTEPLFDKDGRISDDCTFEQLASYIYFTETHTNMDKNKISQNFIGEYGGTEYFLLFEKKGTNALTKSFLATLKSNLKHRVIYADKCLVDNDSLEGLNIEFKQIPYEVKIY